MSISTARKTAYRNLMRIECDLAFSSELLARTDPTIDSRDRNLIYSLTMGVIRNQLLLDAVIDKYSKKPSADLDVEILIILRLAVFQLLFLDRVPDYSVVNEAVELARYAKKKSAAGFVNAVLRKVKKWQGIQSDLPEIEKISVETSHPLWLLERWSRQFGEKRAFSLAAANNNEPRATFRFTLGFENLPESEQRNLQSEIDDNVGIQPSELIEGAFIAEKADMVLRDFAERGFIYFQDEASQMAGEVVFEAARANVLDLCAAPGSKATHLAGKKQKKLSVVAGEIHLQRAELLKENAKRQGVEIETVGLDASDNLPFEKGVFDTILVDAPCSGTGTISRNPEIRYRISQSDIESLCRKQLRMLTNASKLLNKDGVVVYSTCSLELDENEEVIRKFLEENPGFSIQKHNIFEKFATPEGFIRTAPDSEGCDGFFIASLVNG